MGQQQQAASPQLPRHASAASTQPRVVRLAGAYRSGPLTFANLEELQAPAKRKLTANAYWYYASGAESGASLTANRSAFLCRRLLPRVMTDVSRVDTSLTFLGKRYSMPVFVAPMAMQCMAHPDGELAVARACSAVNTCMGVSTMATTALEEVAAAAADPGTLMFQLYVLVDRTLTKDLVQRAEAAGYGAVVVTVDAARLGRREADVTNGFALPAGQQLANLQSLERKLPVHSGGGGGEAQRSGIAEVFVREIDASLTWEFVGWLRSVTRLPILVKGILAPADAQLAVRAGVDGIVLSNHGGRQSDFAPSALEMLPHVVEAIGRQVPIIIDGGVRRGTDVLKALALGADAVLLGRPVLWALTLGGQAGVEQALAALQAELELAMVLTGCLSLKHITRSLVIEPDGRLSPSQSGRSML